MTPCVVAFDTSNYTTSCAVFDGQLGQNAGRLLDVAPGQLGLRQSDALFAHVRRLPEIFRQLDLTEKTIIAVGTSNAPRATADSYMPCFLAGVSHGAVTAHALGVPLFEFSHQQGHIAAAAWSAGKTDLLERPHLAWHLSGGTTELLLVRPEGVAVRCEIVGGTTDVSAGQLIDRAGVALGCAFPAGRALDELSKKAAEYDYFEPKFNNLDFSLSGVEHKMKAMVERGAAPADVAHFTLLSVARTVRRVTAVALERYGEMPVLYTGGVASNSLLRAENPDGIFAEPRYSTDNALGTAILTYRAVTADGQ